MTITNVQQRAVLTGIVDNPGVQTHAYMGAVAVKNGVMETATAQYPYAIVSDSFMSFGMKDGPAPADAASRDLVESVGTFMIGLAGTDYVSAADATTVSAVSGLVDVGTAGSPVATGGSSVTFMGDFSFAASVHLDAQADCSTTGTDLLQRDPTDATMVTDTMKLTAVPPADVAAAMHLCITAKASTAEMPMRIPVTARYVAMTTYNATVTDGMAPADGSEMLGAVRRDGTTVQLPHLTTRDRFNQRIIIINRTDSAARYYLTFNGEDDMAGGDADGMAMPGRTAISLRDDDVVDIGEGTTTSGTLTVEAHADMIDVATVQVNRELGTTDTVLYQAD